MSSRFSSMLQIIKNHKVEVTKMDLFSFLVTRKFALIVAWMDTINAHTIGSMDFFLTLVRIMKWIISLCLYWMKQWGVDDSKSCKGNDSYTFTKDRYDQLVNLFHSSSSVGNLGNSSSKVNLASYSNPYITSGISRISHSLNHLNIWSWIKDLSASDHICSEGQKNT